MVKPATVTEALGPDYQEWVAGLEEVGAPDEPVRLPDRTQAAEQLERLKVPAAASAEVLDILPSLPQDPVVWWLLERSHQRLVGGIGEVEGTWGRWPQLPDGLGSAGRCFYICLYLAVLPHTLAYHQGLGVPEEVSWATLADLGRHVAIHHRMTGATGVDAPGWMTLHLRALLYECGRLQYGLMRATPRSRETDDGGEGPPLQPGDPLLGMHIPEEGPLRPDLCEESLQAARVFFDRYLPAYSEKGIVTCHSWLLDDQLARYLSPASNIVQFQRLFRLLPGGGDGDGDVLFFVFRKRNPDLDELPQRTTLERAVVDHLRKGEHWRVRAGWLRLPAA